MQNVPDQSLCDDLVRFSRGDADAFDRVCSGVSAAVYDVARRVLRDAARAAEVTQEVLLELWLHADRFDPARGSALGWSMAIAHNLAVDRVRSETAEDARRVLYAARAKTTPYDEVADIVEQRLDHEAVRRYLGELSGLQREAVTLVYYRGLSPIDAADLLGISIASIRSRLRDARARLKLFLTDD